MIVCFKKEFPSMVRLKLRFKRIQKTYKYKKNVNQEK
jgi:hypothetical protein